MGVEKTTTGGKAIAKIEEPSDTVTIRMTRRGEQVTVDYHMGETTVRGNRSARASCPRRPAR
jgi:regulation of enolase protein 1 (concanavalin A-like superfamily)